MSDSPETTQPVVAPPEETIAFPAPADRRAWLRAGVLFGGALSWSTAVFGAMVEHELWTGASAGFGLTVVVVSVYALSVGAGYRSPAANVPRLVRRGLVTLTVGSIFWLMNVFIVLVLCERSALGAMLVLGVLGMLAVLMVGLVSRDRGAPRREPAVRAVHALAWGTVLIVSITALMPPLAEAMARRARRAPDAAPSADIGNDD